MGLTEADPKWGVFDGDLTKECSEGKYEIIGEFKHVHVRMDTIIKEDGAEISNSYFIKILYPHMDISSETQEIQDVCNAVWSDEVKQAWSDFQASQEM